MPRSSEEKPAALLRSCFFGRRSLARRAAPPPPLAHTISTAAHHEGRRGRRLLRCARRMDRSSPCRRGAAGTPSRERIARHAAPRARSDTRRARMARGTRSGGASAYARRRDAVRDDDTTKSSPATRNAEVSPGPRAPVMRWHARASPPWAAFLMNQRRTALNVRQCSRAVKKKNGFPTTGPPDGDVMMMITMGFSCRFFVRAW